VVEQRPTPRKPRTIGGAVYVAVLATTVLGIAVVMSGRPRSGLQLCGAALLCGAAGRLVLPDDQAGMLGIRRKLVDVVTMLVLGSGLVVLAALIREPAA